MRLPAGTTLAALLMLSVALAGCETAPDQGPKGFQGYTYPGGPDPLLVFNTNRGPFILQLFVDQAPMAANNILNLTKSGFYDGLLVHRIIGPVQAPPNGWFIQFGDNLTRDPAQKENWGRGGARGNVSDEMPLDNGSFVLRFDKPGVVAMAARGNNAISSQFFITLNATPWLDGNFTIFGQVIAGFETIRDIGNVAADSKNRPLEDVVITRAAVYRPEPPGP